MKLTDQAAKTKICAGCHVEKEVHEFSADNIRRDKLNPYCRACKSAQYFKRRERTLAQYKEYRERMGESLLAKQRVYARQRFFYKRAGNLLARLPRDGSTTIPQKCARDFPSLERAARNLRIVREDV